MSCVADTVKQQGRRAQQVKRRNLTKKRAVLQFMGDS